MATKAQIFEQLQNRTISTNGYERMILADMEDVKDFKNVVKDYLEKFNCLLEQINNRTQWYLGTRYFFTESECKNMIKASYLLAEKMQYKIVCNFGAYFLETAKPAKKADAPVMQEQEQEQEQEKTYYVESFHSIYEDSFEHGELGYKNGYDLHDFVKATNAKKALEKFIFNVLYFEINSYDLEEIHDEETGINWTWRIDEDNQEPVQSKVDRWKQGKYTLYSDNVSFKIYELKEVTSL